MHFLQMGMMGCPEMFRRQHDIRRTWAPHTGHGAATHRLWPGPESKADDLAHGLAGIKGTKPYMAPEIFRERH